MKISKKSRILTTTLLCLGTTFSAKSTAANTSKIEVKGLSRIHPDMVRNIIEIKPNETIDDKRLNSILLKLHATGYFKDIKVGNTTDGKLLITVIENPTINQVSFEGNSNLALEDIQKEVQTRAHSIFKPSSIREDVEAIKTLYKRLGFFKATVDAKTIKRNDNQYDVVFEINEGNKAYIKEIIINGNESFSDSQLKEVIMSKEYSWWKILEMFDTYDEDRILYDTQLLHNHYIDNGFLDFKVNSYNAKMDLTQSDFYVTYNISEGKRYKIGEVNITSEIPDIDTETLKKEILIEKDMFYSDPLAKLSVSKMSEKLGEKGFAFIDIDIQKTPNKETGIVDVTFNIKNSRRAFINKIDIKNNTRTYDRVIRKQLNFDEQDIYNSSNIAASKQKLMETGFFENVNITPVAVLNAPDKININIDVAEKSTGELSLGAGWSSLNKGFFEFGIKETNFMGKGQTLGISSTFSGTYNNYSLTFVEPYLFDRDLQGGVDLSYRQYKYESTYGYDWNTAGLGFTLGWSYNDNLFHKFRIYGGNTKYVNISQNLPTTITEGLGDTNIYRVGQTLTYRDQIIDYVNDTRQGYSISLSNDYAGFGGTKYYIKNTFTAKQYFSFWDNEWQFGILFNAGKIKSLNNTTLSSSDRFVLGGDNLRGFEYGGIGARNTLYTNYTYGGNWEVNGTFQLNFPIGIPKKYKVSGYVFYDWGKLGRPELSSYTNIIYSDIVRTSVGYGIAWNSPIGALNLSWAYPIHYEEYDERQRFRFSIGTDF